MTDDILLTKNEILSQNKPEFKEKAFTKWLYVLIRASVI